MKKTYTKPVVDFEDVVLDAPVALNCDPLYIHVLKDFALAGLFGPGFTCDSYVSEEQMNNIAGAPTYDKLCYHSSASTPFVS